MSDHYLWDKTGEPDPEVERLERLLGRFRHDQPAPAFPAAEPAPKRRLFWTWALVPRLAAAAVIALAVIAGGWFAWRWSRPGWDIERLAGAPRVGQQALRAAGRLGVGEWLETDALSRAKINVGVIGEVELEPNTRVRLLQARSNEHRLALDHGTMHARIWAPPRLFYVNTPSAVAVDLGCRYTLEVNSTGAGILHVTFGWVAFEQRGRESFVPANAMCLTRPGVGPGTPFFEDASAKLRSALEQYDSLTDGVAGGVSGGITGGVPGGVSGGVAGGVPGGISGGVQGGVSGGVEAPAKLRAVALETVLGEARPRDALTLWHLLSRSSDAERAKVYDRLAQLVPPPTGVTREGVLAGVPEDQRRMRDLWWDALGLGDTSWWRMWKGPVPSR